MEKACFAAYSAPTSSNSSFHFRLLEMLPKSCLICVTAAKPFLGFVFPIVLSVGIEPESNWGRYKPSSGLIRLT